MLIEYEDMFPTQATVATAVVPASSASSADADAPAVVPAGDSRRLRDLAEDQEDTTSYNCVSEIKKRN